MTARFESLDPNTAATRLTLARGIEDHVVEEMGVLFTEAVREGEKHHDDPRMLRHLAARAVAGRPGAPPAWKARLAEADTHLWAIALGWISFGVQVGRRHARGMEHDDLEQIVSMALHRAAISWDPQKGAFSTFSANWVKVRCEREERDRDPIPVASGTRGKLALLRNLRGLHPEWDDATLAAESGLSIKRVRSLDHHRDAITKVVSLDAPIEGMERGAMLVEIVADPQSVDPIREVEARHDVDFALAGLGKREGVILRQRYGLGCGHARTLREIGDGRGLSRERIRQITEAAEIKVRANLRQAGRRDPDTTPVICGPRKKVATPTRTKVIALLRAEPGLRNAEIRKRLGVGSPEVYALARAHLGIRPPTRPPAGGDSKGLLQVLALLGEKPDLGNPEIHAALGFGSHNLFATARRRLGIHWRERAVERRAIIPTMPPEPPVPRVPRAEPVKESREGLLRRMIIFLAANPWATDVEIGIATRSFRNPLTRIARQRIGILADGVSINRARWRKTCGPLGLPLDPPEGNESEPRHPSGLKVWKMALKLQGDAGGGRHLRVMALARAMGAYYQDVYRSASMLVDEGWAIYKWEDGFLAVRERIPPSERTHEFSGFISLYKSHPAEIRKGSRTEIGGSWPVDDPDPGLKARRMPSKDRRHVTRTLREATDAQLEAEIGRRRHDRWRESRSPDTAKDPISRSA